VRCVCVQSSNVAVRSSAAEAVGLLYAQCGLHQLPDDEDELIVDSDVDGSMVSNAGTLDCSNCAVSEEARASLQMGFDGIITQMEALAKNRFYSREIMLLVLFRSFFVHA
jgi:hypothetical protein